MQSMAKETLATGKRPGIRERSKRETKLRIIAAARELFADCGYDGATMRDIARKAGLGLGTLSNYVTVKRDLIYLVFNEEVDALTDRALGSPMPEQSFVDKVLSISEHHFRMFASEPVLSRILLSETLQHQPEVHLTRHLGIRARLIGGITKIVRDAQETGEIQSSEPADVIAMGIFFVISASARWFLAVPQPDWRDGQQLCRQILTIMTLGLSHPSLPAQASAKQAKTHASQNTRKKAS